MHTSRLALRGRFGSRPLGGTTRDPCPDPEWRRKRAEFASPHQFGLQENLAGGAENFHFDLDELFFTWGQEMSSTASERRAFAHKINR